MDKFLFAAALILLSPLSSFAQQTLKMMNEKSRACTLPAGLKIVDIDEVDQPMARTVKTAAGQTPVTVQGGLRVLVAAGDDSPFANVKIETVAAEDWKSAAKTLADSVTQLASSSPGVILAKLDGKQLDGFDVSAVERQKLEGGVLSVYELFRERDHLVISAYLLNHENPSPYKSIEDFLKLRDQFADAFTRCLAK